MSLALLWTLPDFISHDFLIHRVSNIAKDIMFWPHAELWVAPNVKHWGVVAILTRFKIGSCGHKANQLHSPLNVWLIEFAQRELFCACILVALFCMCIGQILDCTQTFDKMSSEYYTHILNIFYSQYYMVIFVLLSMAMMQQCLLPKYMYVHHIQELAYIHHIQSFSILCQIEN